MEYSLSYLGISDSTGAVIVVLLLEFFDTLPAIIMEQIGYGSGSNKFSDHLNVLRYLIGKS